MVNTVNDKDGTGYDSCYTLGVLPRALYRRQCSGFKHLILLFNNEISLSSFIIVVKYLILTFLAHLHSEGELFVIKFRPV